MHIDKNRKIEKYGKKQMRGYREMRGISKSLIQNSLNEL